MQANKTCFNIKQVDGTNKRINARICKDITGKFMKHKISIERYKSIWKDLKLADELPDEDKTIRIDVLIGNDYYGSFITGKVIKADKLVAMESKFGWLLSGPIQPNESNSVRGVSCFVVNATADESILINNAISCKNLEK